MPKRQTIAVAIAPNQRKSRGYLILDQKLGKNLKRWKRALLSPLTRTYKASCVKTNPSYYLIVILQCTSWMDCSYNGRYIGESKRKVLTRYIDNQQNSIKGTWELSGANEHNKECHGQFIFYLSLLYKGVYKFIALVQEPV